MKSACFRFLIAGSSHQDHSKDDETLQTGRLEVSPLIVQKGQTKVKESGVQNGTRVPRNGLAVWDS
jgi:hypothetical protein